MTKTEEQNVKIAEFMGYQFYNDAEGDYPNGYWCEKHNSLPMLPEDFNYNDSWNWLMPVVDKIEKHGGDENELDIFGNCVQLGDAEFVGNNKMEAVWKSVCWWVSQHCT